MSTFASTLRGMREGSGLSLADFGRQAGLSDNSIWNFERGKMPSPESLLKLRKVFPSLPDPKAPKAKKVKQSKAAKKPGRFMQFVASGSESEAWKITLANGITLTPPSGDIESIRAVLVMIGGITE